MVRCLVIAFCSLVFTANSFSQVSSPKESQKQSIHGRVIEAKTGQPIRKVIVQVFGGPGQSFKSHTATTSADGTFFIRRHFPGAIRGESPTPRICAENRGPRSAVIYVAARAKHDHVDLQDGSCRCDFRKDCGLGRRPDGRGHCERLSARGPSIPQTGMSGSYGSATTNDLGEYRISDLRPGKYLISALPTQGAPVVHSGENGKPREHLVYATTFYPGTLDQARAIAVEARGGQDAR